MSNVDYGAGVDKDNDLNSVVDEFFSFIYNEPVSDDEMDDVKKRNNEDTDEAGNSLTLNNYVDEVLDKHFSFLCDEPSMDDDELFYSLDGHSKLGHQKSSSPFNLRRHTSSLLEGAHGTKEDDPIYTNISEMLSASPQSKYENSEEEIFNLKEAQPAIHCVPENSFPSQPESKPARKKSETINNQCLSQINEYDNLFSEQCNVIQESNIIPQASGSCEVEKISENIFQIGNNAVIKISDENACRNENVAINFVAEPNVSSPVSQDGGNSGKSSVYLNYEDSEGWRKRQRKHEHASAFNPAYTIQFNSDGKDPLVYALCTESTPDNILEWNDIEDLQKASGSHRPRNNSYAAALGIYLENMTKINKGLTENTSSDSSSRNICYATKPKLKKRSSFSEVPGTSSEFPQHFETKSEQKKKRNNERAVTNSNCSLTAVNTDRDISRERHNNLHQGLPETEASVSTTKFQQQKSSKLSSNDLDTLIVQNVIPLLDVNSKVKEPSCSYQSFYNPSTESDRDGFLLGRNELNTGKKSKNVEQKKSNFYLSDKEKNDAPKKDDNEEKILLDDEYIISKCNSQRDLEKLLSLDRQVQQLENKDLGIDYVPAQSDFSSEDVYSNTVAEAINLEVVPSNDNDYVTSSEVSVLSPLSDQSSFKSTCMTQAISFDSDDDQIIKIELISNDPDNRIHFTNSSDVRAEFFGRKSLERQRSFDYDNHRRELVLRSFSEDHQNMTLGAASYDSRLEALDQRANEGIQRSSSNDEANVEEDRSLGSALSGVIRRSMRRMKHIRLSGRRSKNVSKNLGRSRDPQNISEETEARHHLPTIPQMGLPSVRSPAASAILLPSILAALTPNEPPPREIFPSPDEVMVQPRNHERSNSADYLDINRTHHRSGEISPDSGNSTRPPRTNNPNRPSDQSRIIRLQGHTVPTINQNTRQTHNRNHSTVESPTGSVNADGAHHSEVPEPIARVTVNGTPVPVRGNNNPSVSINNNATSANNRRNNRHTRNARERQRRRQSVDASNSRNNNNTSTSSATSINISNISSNNSNNNNNISPRRTSGTPSRQTSSSRLSSDGDLRANADRERVMRPVAHPQGFKPPTRTTWPHGHSSLMASLPVTLNMFNISRFAVLGAAFGWQFPIQWLVISLVVALPLMAFHAAIGQAIGGSVIDMWVISPIFQGVGYAMLFVEIVLGIYCCLPVAWLFTYFRDSFDLRHFRCISFADCGTPANLSREINTYVTGFFSTHILQRSDNESSVMNSLGSLKFDLSFNIALIWVITFLALSRGTRSYGKICYVIYFAPLVCYFSVCFYMMYWANNGLELKNFGSRFIDRQPWLAASREAFLVWGLHGAVIQQMAAGNKKRHPVWRDTSTMAVFTICGLCFASFLGMLCISALESKGLIYHPSSFENEDTRAFVDVQIHLKDTETILMERNTILGPPQYLRPEPVYDNFYSGIRIRDEYLIRMNPRVDKYRSGYNCLRLMTELFPALLFSKNGEFMSAWAPLFYLSLLLFGLAQQLSVWHTVVQGVLRLNYPRLAAWETFIAFCCCLFGFSAALPMASGAGIHIIYFLDYAIGSVWWIMILQLIMVFAVLFVRGKPFSAKDMAYKFFGEGRSCSTPWTATPVAFFWTIIVPVGLLILSISSFKNGNYREVFAWASMYWSTFTCQMASTFQLFPLLLVPLVGLIQTCKYLADPRQDLFERIQHLYRPPVRPDEDDPFPTSSSDGYDPLHLPYSGIQSPTNDASSPLPYMDPPPKYTPPPSYSTATGSGFTKLFNRSFRTWRNTLQNQSTASSDIPEVSSTPAQVLSTTSAPFIPSPDYSPSVQPPGYPQQSGYINQAAIGDSSPSCNSPPQYATLDPLRLQMEFHSYNSNKSSLIRREFQRSQNGTCQFCGAAQSRHRRSNTDGGSSDVNYTLDSGQISETSGSRENDIIDEASSADTSSIKQNRAIIGSENLDSGMSSNSDGNGLSNGSRFNERYHPGAELNNASGSETPSSNVVQCINPSCPGQLYSNLPVNSLPRIASYPSNPFRRSNSLRRSWTSSLRRSARRIAAAISSTNNNSRNRYFEGAILVSDASNNNLTDTSSQMTSTQNIATHSEA